MLSKEDKQEFMQLRQRLQPLLNRQSNDLLKRIQGEIGANLTIVHPAKVSKKEITRRGVAQYL